MIKHWLDIRKQKNQTTLQALANPKVGYLFYSSNQTILILAVQKESIICYEKTKDSQHCFISYSQSDFTRHFILPSGIPWVLYQGYLPSESFSHFNFPFHYLFHYILHSLLQQGIRRINFIQQRKCWKVEIFYPKGPLVFLIRDSKDLITFLNLENYHAHLQQKAVA